MEKGNERKKQGKREGQGMEYREERGGKEREREGGDGLEEGELAP